jgi:hypothetical protein
VEHELGHAGQAKDEFGGPRFSRETGKPLFTMRPHDVEVFVFEAERYGVQHAAGKSAEFVAAANRPPTIAAASIAAACGACLR